MPSWAKWGLALLIAVGLIAVGWRVLFVLVTLHVLVCFVLIIVIMLQSGSAADLAGAFGGAGSQTAFGPRGAATFLSHATTWCAIVFMMTSLTLSVKRAPSDVSTTTGSVLEQTQKSGTAPTKPAQPAPIQIPIQPTQQPAQQPAPAQQQPAPSQQPRRTPLLINRGFCYTSVSSSSECGRGGIGRRTSLRGWR
jgi:preprotein translocase subunit SecG